MTNHQIDQALALAEHMATCRCAIGADGLCGDLQDEPPGGEGMSGKRRASVHEREVWGNGKARGKDGKRVREYRGKETVRTAHCGHPGHHATNAFEGVNAAGWIFRCSGTRDEPGSRHLFFAEPPEEAS